MTAYTLCDRYRLRKRHHPVALLSSYALLPLCTEASPELTTYLAKNFRDQLDVNFLLLFLLHMLSPITPIPCLVELAHWCSILFLLSLF